MAHYAARSGELSLLVYLRKRDKELLSRQDCFGHPALHYAVMSNKFHVFLYLYMKLGLQFNSAII